MRDCFVESSPFLWYDDRKIKAVSKKPGAYRQEYFKS